MPTTRSSIRCQLLAASACLLQEGGLAALRMDILAQRLSISKKTIYKCFRSKEELLGAMLDATHARRQVEFQQALDQEAGGLRARLQRLVHLGWEVGEELRGAAAQNLRDGPTWLWVRHRQFWETTVRASFTQLLTEGRQLGLLRPDVPMPVVLDIISSPIFYHLEATVTPLRDYSSEEAHTTFFTLLFEGLHSRV